MAPILADERTGWFEAEIRVHESALRNWLRARFPAISDREDIVQESFLRVWQARLRGPIESPKAFLFAIARNHAIDVLQREHRQGGLGDSGMHGVLDESMDTCETVARAQELQLLRAAIQSLPERCREVFVLRRFHGLSHKEIAAKLGISEKTVEAQHTIAMHKCVQFFQNPVQEKSSPPVPAPLRSVQHA